MYVSSSEPRDISVVDKLEWVTLSLLKFMHIQTLKQMEHFLFNWQASLGPSHRKMSKLLYKIQRCIEVLFYAGSKAYKIAVQNLNTK